MIMKTCQACRFFKPQSEVKGECRYLPPTLQVNQNGPNFSAFPPMPSDGWCGVFSNKEPNND